MRAIGALSAAADPLLLGRALESRLDRLRGCWIMLPMTFAEVAPPLAHGHRLKGRLDHVLDALRLLGGDAKAAGGRGNVRLRTLRHLAPVVVPTACIVAVSVEVPEQ